MDAEVKTGRPSESGHWYARDGSALYQIRGSNGAMRAVTLRDARKLGLVPGVSSIAGMEYKPALERWKIEQALMSAITLPRSPDEDDGAFLARAREDSQEQARRAAELGTGIHTVIQGYFEGQECDHESLCFVEPVVAWLKQRYGLGHWQAEQSFAHPLGYGGKCDLQSLQVPAIIDFKCKDFGPEKSADDLAWPEHAMQLVAYAHGFDVPKAECLNIFVSTRVPGLIRVREWDAEECGPAWEAFQCLLKLWQIRRKYYCGFTMEQAA